MGRSIRRAERSMSKIYLRYDPDQQLLLPAALQEWLPEDPPGLLHLRLPKEPSGGVGRPVHACAGALPAVDLIIVDHKTAHLTRVTGFYHSKTLTRAAEKKA